MFFQGLLESLTTLSPTILLGTCLAGIFLIINIRVLYNIFFHPLARYPGPISWTSNAIPYQIALLKGTTHLHSARLHKKYGPVVRVSPNELSYITAQAWADIYGRRHPKQLQKHPDIISGPSGGVYGLANTPNDQDHSRMRRLMAPGFSEKAVRAQENIFRDHIGRLIAKIRDNEGNGTIDLTLFLHATTFDIITDSMFGESANTLETGTDWMSLTMPLARGRIVNTVASSYSTRIIPILRRLLPGMVPNAAIQFFQNTVIALDRRLTKPSCDDGRPDILQHVLPYLDKPNGLTLPELQTTLRSLMIAGSETSASILTSAHYFVLSNPRVYERLLSEIRCQFASDRDITGTSVNRCKYLVAVLEETMRIWPAIAISLPRITPPEGCEIDGLWVPGGIKVGVNQWAAYSSDCNFARPNEFLPERWLEEGKEEFANDIRAAFQPFSTGPRNCLGMNFARTETRTIFAYLLFDFEMELLTSHEEWDAQKVFIMWSRCSLRVKARQVTR